MWWATLALLLVALGTDFLGTSSAQAQTPNAPVTVVRDAGRSNNRVDVVFLGDGYQTADMTLYRSQVQSLSTSMFNQVPLYEFENYFNIHRVDLISNDRGVDHDPILYVSKDTVLDSGFWCQTSSETLCTNVAKAWDYAALARGYDQVIVLANSSKTGSSGFAFSDMVVQSAGQSDVVNSLLHVFGHSFANLADETDTGNWPQYTGFEPAEPNVSAQTAESMTLQKIKWHRWLGTDWGSQYGGLIGAYEGAMGYGTKIYRPSLTSKMRVQTQGFNLPSIESFIIQIYRLVSPIDDSTPVNAVLTGSDTITVVPMQLKGRALSVQWYLNGSAVAGATGNTFRPNNYPLADGTYTVSVIVRDNTPFVRDEAARDQYMTASRAWTVAVDQNPPVILTHPASQTKYVNDRATFSVVAQGEDLTYQWYRNGSAISGATSTSYTTPNLARSDDDSKYWVVVSNVAGSVTSNQANLTIANRLPNLSIIADQQMVRSELRQLAVFASDQDNDPIVYSAVIVPVGANPGATLSLSGTNLSLRTGSTFLGVFDVTVTATDGFDFVSRTFRVTVINRAPVIPTLASRNMHWRTDFITVPLAGSDPDGDPISYSASVVGNSPVAVSISGSDLIVNPASIFLGSVVIQVNVSDGMLSSSTNLIVNVTDRSPVIPDIADQRMHYKADSLSVPVAITDPDADPLTVTVGIVPGMGNIAASVSYDGNNVIINPSTENLGAIRIFVRATDGLLTEEKTFLFTVYNTPPDLADLADLAIHWNEVAPEVNIQASDADNDPLTFEVASYVYSLPYWLDQAHNFALASDGWTFDALGLGEKYLVGDKRNGGSYRYYILPDGTLYEFKGGLAAPVKLAVLPPAYYLDPTLLVDVPLPSSVQPVHGTVTGAKISFQVPTGYRGTTQFTVSALDGKASMTKSFLFTVFDETILLNRTKYVPMHWTVDKREITLLAPDSDGHTQGNSTEFSVGLYDMSAVYALDQANNFIGIAPTTVATDNMSGRGERYLLGRRSGQATDTLYAILPNGELYSCVGSLSPTSTLVASLPGVFFLDPLLLVDVPSLTPPPVALSVQGNTLRIDPEPGYTGKVLARVQATDERITDSEVILIDIYNHAPVLAQIDEQTWSWMIDKRSVPYSAGDENSEDRPNLVTTAWLGTVEHLAYQLDTTYNFSKPSPTFDENARGWREKWLKGSVSGTTTDFFVLPSGALYRYTGAMATSTLVGRFPAYYYMNPSRFIDVFNPGVLPPVIVKIENGQIVIDPPAQYTGIFWVTYQVTDGQAHDTRMFVARVMNAVPKLAPIPEQKLHWRTDKVLVPLAGSDPDGDAITYDVRLVHPFGVTLPVSVSMEGNTIVVDPEPGYIGSFSVQAIVRDAVNEFALPFLVTVYNNAPVLTDIGTKALGYKEDKLVVALSGSDPDAVDGPYLKYSAWLGDYRTIAYQLDQVHDFAARTQGYEQNKRGRNEKYIRGTVGGAPSEYVILPNGELYQFGGSFPTGAPLARLGTEYYTDPQLLFNVSAPLPLPDIGVTVVGSTLTVDPRTPLYTGNFPVTVVLTDGNLYDTETITVAVVNRAPVLAQPANQNFHWKTDFITVPLVATDADGDTLTYTASAVQTVPVLLSISGSTLKIDPQNNYVGTFTVNANVSDGTNSATKQFSVTVRNSIPVISTPANATLGWKQSYTADVVVTDADGDVVTLTASAIENGGSVGVSLVGRRLTVTPNVPWNGLVKILLTATDGASTSNTAFTITFANRAPVLQPIPGQVMKWRESSRAVQLTATDPDGEVLTYSARVTQNTQGGTVTVSGRTLTILPASGFIGSFTVTATVSDGMMTHSQSFRVDVLNTLPFITPLANRSIHWRTTQVIVPLSASDNDGDTVSFSARLGDTSFPANVSVSANNLIVNFTAGKVGACPIVVSAYDGIQSATAQFTITVTNTAPVLDPIPNQVIDDRHGIANIDVSAYDANSDPLTYSAELVPLSRIPYALDQEHNFELRFGDYYYNRLGNLEKYIQGTKNEANGLYWYSIFPNGKLYEWKGSLSASRLIAILPTDFYANPSKLFNVPVPAAETLPVLLSWNGPRLSLNVPSTLTDRFLVYVSVTDTKATARTSFMVEQKPDSDLPPGSPPMGDECDTKVKVHDGDYSCKAKTSFAAIGRIGDAASSPGNRTFEVGVSKDSKGSFGAGEAANYIWINNRVVNFSLDFDPATKLAVFTVDGVTVSHTATLQGPTTDLFLRAYSKKASNSITVDGLRLNGEPLIATVSGSSSAGPANTLQLQSPQLMGRFKLEGRAVMKFGSVTSETPKDSDLSFEIIASSDDDHSSLCSGDDDGHKVTICHIPPGNPEAAHTIKIGRSALEAHLAHGDVIGECPGAPSDPGDGGGSCEEKRPVASPNYSLWNSFLNMTNILELVNPGLADLPVKISFYSINGELLHERTVVVPATNQFDVIVNDLPGFIRDSYGIVRLDFTGTLEGRMMYYRAAPEGGGFDFVFGFPFTDASFGTTAVSFNTFQPSMKPDEMNNVVANWLAIVNLDSRPQVFTIDTYNQVGYLILRRVIEVPAFGRFDIDGGHGIAGPSVVGVHIIRPQNITAEYIAQLSRFGGDTPAGYAPSKYRFALPLVAKLGQSDPIYAPISNKFGEMNWLEVVNILDRPAAVAVNLFSHSGQLIESIDATLEPHAQVHLDAASYLPPDDTGYAEIIPREPYSVIAQSMGYLRERTSGSVRSIYGAQARRALPCYVSGSYNLFLNMQNWLTLANPSNESITATLLLTGPNINSEKTYQLGPRASVHLPLHDPAAFGLRADTYGQIIVKGNATNTRLFAEVMRLRYRNDGLPDFATIIPVR